jgi:hypothetical protein
MLMDQFNRQISEYTKIIITSFLFFLIPLIFFSLDVQENLNSKSYLSTIKMQVLENLRCIQHAPSVQLQEVSRQVYAKAIYYPNI